MNLDRLAKFLRLLASPIEGERLAALRAIDTWLSGADKDWDWLAERLAGEARPSPRRGRETGPEWKSPYPPSPPPKPSDESHSFKPRRKSAFHDFTDLSDRKPGGFDWEREADIFWKRRKPK